jgi:diguanylate cyclase (GGDEF)-like protein/PAS domain S-box-containing protein
MRGWSSKWSREADGRFGTVVSLAVLRETVNFEGPRADERRMNGTRAAIGFAVLAAALVAAPLVVPDDRSTVLIAAVAGATAVAAMLLGLVRSRPVRPTPWLMFVVGSACWVAAVVVGTQATISGTRTVPGPSEALLILGVPWMVVGVGGIISVTRRVHDLLAGSESLVVALAASASLWLVVVDPWLAGRDMPLPMWSWFTGLIAADLIMAALALRAAAGSVDDRQVIIIVASGFVMAAIAHAGSWWWLSGSPADVSTPAVSALLVTPLLLGVASLACAPPARRHRSDLTEDHDNELRYTVHRDKVIGLTIAAVVPVTALGLTVLFGEDAMTRASILVVSCSSIVVVGLVIARVLGMVAQVREVAEHQGQIRLAAMVEFSNDVVMIVGSSGTVIYASPGFTAALGHHPEAWIGRALIDVVDESDRALAEERFSTLLGMGRDHTIEFETTLVRRDGQRRHGSVVLVNLLGDDAVDGVVATFRDITEQRDLERRLSHRAFHDELTGLANRALFLDRMDHALRVERHDGRPVMVLFIDLDDFKDVNDVHGHGVGDETLRAIASRIRESTDPGDTAARLGGDEFAVLLENDGGIDRAIELAERLLSRLHDPVVVGGTAVVVLASIGIAIAPTGASTTSLLRDADIAMYEAKRSGKGQVRIFDPAMRRIASTHLAYRNELTTAIERDQLRVVYLPYVDLATGEVRGAEALVRWHHPEHGDITPAEFIPIAERTGLIVPIGRWVLGEALDQAARWRDDTELFVSVNLSAAELRQHDLLERLREAVRARGVEPQRLVLEVTETDLMEGGDRALRTVADLRDHGFGVALDNFGAGYCSISHLQRHPVDMIKIDPAYVGELGPDATGTTLARAILRLAETLDLCSAAEGIETPEQLHELRRSGCRLGQGYLLSGALEGPVAARRFGHTGDAVAGHAVASPST